MNWGEILVANGAGLFLMLIMIKSRKMTKLRRRPVDRIFSAIIVIVIAGTILEPLTFLLNGTHGGFFRFLSIFSNTLEYFCTAAASVLWVWYVDLNLYKDVKRLKKKYMPMIIIGALLVLLLIGNIFGGFLFSFDGNNVYSREPLGYIYFLFLAAAYITSISTYYSFRAEHGNAQFFPLWMFLAPLIVSLVIQVIFYGISVTFLGCAVGIVSIYLNLIGKQSLVDGLTGLYNRLFIEHELIAARKSKKYIYSGIMLDINDFKSINDTLGHSVGDEALETAASMLIKATDRDSIAFRFAGDEFVILVRTASGDPEVLEKDTLAIEARIRRITEKFNNSDTPYKVAFSMGHAMYDTTLSDDDFFRSMDEEMYKDKQRIKKLLIEAPPEGVGIR